MVSSVTIDDDLKRKLKMSAVKNGTTQAEIIRRAIALLEAKETTDHVKLSSKVQDELRNATIEVYRKNSRRKKIAEALKKPGINIDDLRILFEG